MKKILETLLTISICISPLSACAKSNDSPDNNITVNKSYEYFDLTIERLENIVNTELVDYLPDEGSVSFEKSSDLGYTVNLKNDLYVFAVVSEENDNNVWRIAIGQNDYTEETDHAKEIGEITRIFSNLLSLNLTDSKFNELVDRYNNCYSEEKGFHGSLVDNHVLFNLALEKNLFDKTIFEVGITPSKFSSDEEYQNDSDFNDFKIRYCPALSENNIPENIPQTDENNSLTTNEPSTNQTSSYYGPGMYKVGVDIPAGEYNVKAEVGELGYLEVSSDPNGTSIITNDAFENNSYVSISDGQYLKLESCYISQ